MNAVFDQAKDCCGCKSCMAICPTNAIKMVPDEFGFEYPRIDQSRCIDCERCRTVCPMPLRPEQASEAAFAVVLDDEAIRFSASGGAFYALAKAFLEEGGIVFGCAFNDTLVATHIEVQDLEGLRRLQGSKYVQSELSCHRRILELLKSGKQVLFSGTPCQTAAMASFVGRYCGNLTTVELVCHGVPSPSLWKDYVDSLENKHKGIVKDFSFRAKCGKSPFGARYSVETKGCRRSYSLPSVLSWYYYAFLKGKTYRKSCYHCPFAKLERQADVTVCDFWGYQGKAFRGRSDVSAVLIQGKKGFRLFDRARKYLVVSPATPADVALENEQLRQPTAMEKFDERLFLIWREQGAVGLECQHRKAHWKAFLLHALGCL